MRTKIGVKAIAAMEPNSLLWDVEVRGFSARRQFSNVITYSIIYRSREGVQRWHKLGRHPILTPDLARKEAIRVLRDVTLGNDPSGARYELRHSMDVETLCLEYQKDMESGKINGKKASTIRSDKSRIKNQIVPNLGRYKVALVTQDQLERLLMKFHRAAHGGYWACSGRYLVLPLRTSCAKIILVTALTPLLMSKSSAASAMQNTHNFGGR
jgi:hypothetical protein